MANLAGELTALSVDVSDTLTAIPQVVSIDGPNYSNPSVETTVLGAASKSYRANSLNDVGEMSFSINFDSANAVHQELVALAGSGATVSWQQTWKDTSGADAATLDFEGFITEFSYSGAEDESNVMAECSVQLQAAPTFAESA